MSFSSFAKVPGELLANCFPRTLPGEQSRFKAEKCAITF
jgi:hypothetical protein